jgi:hypothetical protein
MPRVQTPVPQNKQKPFKNQIINQEQEILNKRIKVEETFHKIENGRKGERR